MKRTPLQRRSPLRARRTRMARAVAAFAFATGKPQRKTKHARRPRGIAYMGWVKRQRCAVAVWLEELHRVAGNRMVIPEPAVWCEGPIEADHAGNRFNDGDGTRAHDRTCIPLCRKHHAQRTNAGGTKGQAGIFFGFTCGMIRAWSDRAIELTQAAAKLAGVPVPLC